MNSILFKSAAALLMLSLVPGCSDDDGPITNDTGGGSSGAMSGGGGSGGAMTGGGGRGGAMTGGGGSGGAMTGGGGSGGSTAQPVAPTVVSTLPLDGAVDVALNEGISALFSEAMDPATLNDKTFTLTSGAEAFPVDGTVVYADSTAVFWPAVHLASNGMYTATVSTGAESSAGVGLADSHAWSFTTGKTLAPGLPVALGTAGDYVILAKAAVSTVPTSAVTGNVAVSPAAATFITGFSLSADATNVFATSPQITGKVYAADYAPPTPSNLTTAVGDMELAFTAAAARAPDFTEVGAGNISGMTLEPGVYKWGTSVLIPTNVTLNGSATDVWIFQIAQDLTVGNGTNVVLAGGALPKNVFWQVAGFVDVGTTAYMQGVVLSQTSITLHTGASIHGRLLAQTAVNIDSSTVVEPVE